MNSAIELRPEYATVSHAVRFDGDDGIEDQRRALQALLSRCGNKGLQEAVKQEKRHIEAMEQECSASAPGIYSASVSGVHGRGDRFRHGTYRDRAYMTVDDFAAYYSQCRQSTPIASGAQELASTVTAKDCMDSGVILCSAPAEDRDAVSVPEDNKKKKTERAAIILRAERVAKEWLEPEDKVVRCRDRGRAFPLSMVASFVMIAVSLMLLVSGTVMVAGVKNDVGELKHDVAQLADVSALLEGKYEAGINYLDIYRIATEEYGMIEADFVRGASLGADTENYIEIYEKDEEEMSGFSTILAAIGIHIGE